MVNDTSIFHGADMFTNDSLCALACSHKHTYVPVTCVDDSFSTMYQSFACIRDLDCMVPPFSECKAFVPNNMPVIACVNVACLFTDTSRRLVWCDFFVVFATSCMTTHVYCDVGTSYIPPS